MVIYESIQKFIECGIDTLDRINRLSVIIRLLEDSMINATINGDIATGTGVGHVEEYSLDDGQTKIREKYRDVSAIAATIDKFDFLRQKLIARLNNQGNRVFRLVDSKSFNGCR